ncbi:MAG: glycosyltransferase family 4 protein [Pyrinomonadaceae bacterium]
MKVLTLASYPIEAASTRYRVAQYIEPLAQQGITLTLHPFLDSKLHRALYKRSEWPRTALGLLRASLRRLTEVVKAHDADVLFVQREAMMYGPPIFEWLALNIGHCPMVLDLDDATYVPYRSPTYGDWATAAKWFSKTDKLIDWSQVVVCGNRTISDYVSARAKRAVIIPTVVSTEVFRPRLEKAANNIPVLGWIGTHSTFQYLESIFPMLEKLAQELRFKLKVIGAGDREIRITGVEVENLPWSLHREIEDFQSLDIGLYPIIEDEWSVGKSGFKAIQYMSVGIPFVGSPVGACAELGEPDVTHFLANTTEDWRQSLSRLITDPDLRHSMGSAGRHYAENHYSLDLQVRKLVEVFRSVVSSESTGS